MEGCSDPLPSISQEIHGIPFNSGTWKGAVRDYPLLYCELLEYLGLHPDQEKFPKVIVPGFYYHMSCGEPGLLRLPFRWEKGEFSKRNPETGLVNGKRPGGVYKGYGCDRGKMPECQFLVPFKL